jgi:hypothetical protein
MDWTDMMRNFGGYFVNGLVISILFTALSLVFFSILTLLLVPFGGLLNGILAKYIWNLEVKSDAWGLLKQGVFVYIAVLVENLLAVVLLYVVLPLEVIQSNLIPVTAIILIIQAPLLGYPCRLIAEHYEEDEEYRSPDIATD